jgi:uncharacterized membrane protein
MTDALPLAVWPTTLWPMATHDTSTTDSRTAAAIGAGSVTLAGADVPTGPPGRLALAAFMFAAGVTHFVAPGFYERIVPHWAGNPKFHVAWSGVAEIVAGTLLAVPPTRRVGAWLTLVILVAVYPANIQMVIDAGRPRNAEGVVAWVRLPLQLPMLWAALRQTR